MCIYDCMWNPTVRLLINRFLSYLVLKNRLLSAVRMSTYTFSREKNYHAHSGAIEIERQWFCFSPTTKKPYFQRCWLFGDPSEMRKEWANSVSGIPKNFGVKIKSHEKTQSHLDASIAFGQWKAGQRIDRIEEQTSVTEATFWRSDLLFASDNKHFHGTRHDEPGIAREPRTRGRWRLPRWQLPRSRGGAGASNPSE